jgi:hypothetical protein
MKAATAIATYAAQRMLSSLLRGLDGVQEARDPWEIVIIEFMPQL